jgi:hypothetical protein
MLQLACQWNLAHPAVRCVAPTLIQESGDGARTIEGKRAELAALTVLRARPDAHLSAVEVEELRAIGDNTGCMSLKGASVRHEGEPLADRWPLDAHLRELAANAGIDPDTMARRQTARA